MDGPPKAGRHRGQLGGVFAASLVTDVTELVIGAGCLVAAPGASRRARWLGALLAVAGLAAVIHAVISMAT
jgi:hypothetical protein